MLCRMVRKFLLAAMVISLTACNPIANLDASEGQVSRFQDIYSAGQYDDLYAFVGDEFREATTRDQFQDLMDVVSSRLGALESSERASWNVNTNNGVTITTVVMTSQYELGEGSETYVFHGHGEEMSLVRWAVQSDRLIFNAEDLRHEKPQAAPEKGEAVTKPTADSLET